MSYRVDIPTLSANEVYTLTFEYEGTETIQLIVGDLTLETTDRRVVFTTTSPVNYIESNVNLTNLNMYEGYYESDDFGGEYTQESYIEGKSLVNLIQSQKHLDFQNRDCGVETFEDNMIKLTITDPSSLTSTWQHGWVKTSANLKVGATYTCVVHVVENTISTKGMTIGASYGKLVHGSASNSLGGGETGVIVFTYTTATATLKNYNGYYDGFCRLDCVGSWQNGSLKYGIMIFEGDYYDYFINNNIPYFEGIGCVKSPKIASQPEHQNVVITNIFELSSESSSGATFDKETQTVTVTGSARYTCARFYFQPQKWGYEDYSNMCVEFDVVEIGKLKDGKNPCFGLGQNCTALNGYNGATYLNEGDHVKVAFSTSSLLDVRSSLISFYTNESTAGINNKLVITNFTMYHIDDLDEVGTYDCCKISTPDDLELYCNHHYDRTTKISSPCYQDILDLTTGTITRKNIKVRLNDYIAKYGTVEGALVTADGGNMVRVKYNHMNTSTGTFPVQIEGEVTGLSVTGIALNASQGGYDGTWFTTDDIEHAYTNTNTIWMFFNPSRFDGIDYTDSETIKNWLIEQDFTLVIKIHNTSVYTEQLPTSINPLKSYRNGSIQTSSQQLAPTLKTTLPISNKFTTTNLTSGSTYNVYFDGTATKLDAGGTIITDPVSPCEVECGGTTLTIEGTNIQNVRVLETTNKNEVGSVCGTTDVELNRVITSDLEVITNDIEFSSVGTDNGNINTVDNKLGTINTKGPHTWGAGYFTSNKTYPKGFSLLHIEFDVDMPSNNLMAIINFNNNVSHDYYNFRDLTLDNDTATIAQGQTSGVGVRYSSIVTKGHFSRLMYCFSSQGKINLNINTGSSAMSTASGNNAEGSTSGYTACAGNGITISNFKVKVIENYPNATTLSQITSSLRTDNGLTVIWQDMDMSIGQSISTLEQPIKLRSLGTTYDSYNPVTGELTKRIGVSETDGSYSVLSSPIVTNVPMGEQITNIVNKTPTNATVSNVTFEGNAIKVSNGYGIFLLPEMKPLTKYTAFVEYITNGRFIVVEGTNVNGNPISNNGNQNAGTKLAVNFTTRSASEHILTLYAGTTLQIMIVEGTYSSYDDLPYFEGVAYKQVPPQLYTNGQVKVYSDSEVYPTTILNGQSTNNYEVNELNKSNNYTIRYDGECESIILNGKSNEQGTNRIVKTSTNGSGNLTFVNDNGDIDNVLLVQNDVREQEINHFTGLETVEVSKMLIENQRNMWSQDYIIDTTLTAGYKRISKDYIKVVPNETLYCSTGQAWMDYSDIIQYNENKERVTSTQIFGWPTNGMYQDENNIYKNKVQLSENTHYIRICMHQGMVTTASVSRGDFLPPSTLAYNQYQGQYIDLPQPVQLNSLLDGTHDTYNPITGEYTQNVGYFVLDDTFASSWRVVKTKDGKPYAQRDLSTQAPHYNTLVENYSFPAKLYDYQTGTKAIANIPLVDSIDHTSLNVVTPSLYGDTYFGNYFIKIALPFTPNDINQWNYSNTQVNDWLRENPIHIVYKRTEPITTQLTPIEIPTFESGILQLITTDDKVFPMVEYSMPTNNRYDTSSWETGAVYTQRNMTEAYFNDSTTPMTPTETMTLTTDHISSGSIILNDNGNGLIVLKGNYTGRDIPYFTGMRSVEAIEVETTPSPDQPLFGKGGRK